MGTNFIKLNNKKIAVFLVDESDPSEETIYKVVGTLRWNGQELSVNDVDYGGPFLIPNGLYDLICEADEQTREIVPEADYVIVMPFGKYPYSDLPHKE